MEIWQSILLGIIQGFTEWLPVSSSGHLVIFQEVLKIKADILFDVLLHVGSLLALLVVFRKEIIKIIKSFYDNNYREYRKLAYLIVIGTIGTAIIVSLFK